MAKKVKAGFWPSYDKSQPYQTIEIDGEAVKGKRDIKRRFEQMGLPEDMRYMTVLDIGCNLGEVARECERRGATAFGFDGDKKTVKEADKLEPKFNLFHLDIDKCKEIPYWQSEYDIIFCLSIIKHVKKKNLARWMNEIKWKQCYFEGHVNYFNQPEAMEMFCKKFKIDCTVTFLGYSDDQKPRPLWVLDR